MNAQPSAELAWANVQSALVMIDSDHLIVDINPAGEGLFGTSAKHLVSRPIADALRFDDNRLNEVLTDIDANLAAHHVPVSIRGLRKLVNVDIGAVGSSPTWRLLNISAIPEDHWSGEVSSRAGDQLGVSAPNVLSHEIKNPLAAIRGSAQLLARSINDDLKPHTQMIISEVDRIAKLLNRMQSLSASQPANLEAVNIHSLINDTRELFLAANGVGVSINDQFDPSLPKALVDPDYMKQVLTNLLANAIDAVKNVSEPKIEILTRFSFGASFTSQGSNEKVRLPIEVVVRDNGPGISQSLKNDIFSPFVTTKSEGQGLGLALVRKLVADMNGRVKYDRLHDMGLTQFTVFLPMAEQE